MSKAKQKGTAAETAVVRWLNSNGFPTAERRALTGQFDQGDVTGIPGLVIEVKNHKSYKIPEWLKETLAEKANAKADIGLLVIKPNGVGDTRVGEWWVVLTLSEVGSILRELGYGNELEGEEQQ
jgi:Holliday junction resolvase